MYYEVVDNFLPKDIFDHIKKSIVFNLNFEWIFNGNVTYSEEDLTQVNEDATRLEHSNENIYGIHMLYNRNVSLGTKDPKPWDLTIDYNYINLIKPLWEEINPDIGMIRVKVNFYPYVGPKIIEHNYHTDYEFPHMGAIFSLNTCNGYTTLSDGTKIDSIENRMLFFNPGEFHKSSNCTDSKGRFNINFNWM